MIVQMCDKKSIISLLKMDLIKSLLFMKIVAPLNIFSGFSRFLYFKIIRPPNFLYEKIKNIIV